MIATANDTIFKAKVSKWIFDIGFPWNHRYFGINRNDFSNWAIQIDDRLSEVENPKIPGIQPNHIIWFNLKLFFFIFLVIFAFDEIYVITILWNNRDLLIHECRKWWFSSWFHLLWVFIIELLSKHFTDNKYAL